MRQKARSAAPALLVLLSLAAPFAPLEGADRTLHLPIGDAERRGREAPVVLDGVTDTRTGEILSAGELAPRLAGVTLLLVGESHTDIEYHRVQLRVIEGLVKAGRRVFVGLEMYPYTEQRWLDEWVGGSLTEEGFLRLSRWYEAWGYAWGYYRDIFLFARDHGVRLFAANAPRETISELRKKGLEALPPEARAHLPPVIVPSDADHRALFQSYFGEDDPLHSGMTEEQWAGMLGAQAGWDATMAHNALKALREEGRPGTVLVLLAGSGHVAYGAGIARQAAQAGRDVFEKLGGRIATLVPVNVSDGDGEPVPAVRASYADFVWGVPAAGPALYPSLGLSTKAPAEGAKGGLPVILVSEGTPAAAAGVEAGDLLLALDGEPVRSKGDLNRIVAGRSWGDRVAVTLSRGGVEKEVGVVLRREGPAAGKKEEGGGAPPKDPKKR